MVRISGPLFVGLSERAFSDTIYFVWASFSNLHKICSKTSRIPVRLGYTKTSPGSVHGYARLNKNVTRVSSRLRSVTQKRNQGQFSVTLGYTKT